MFRRVRLAGQYSITSFSSPLLLLSSPSRPATRALLSVIYALTHIYTLGRNRDVTSARGKVRAYRARIYCYI